MRPSVITIVAAVALAVSACGGDDATSPATTPASTGPTTTVVIPIVTDRCEDVPDVADYPTGSIPPAIRPCTQPTELTVQVIRPGVGRAAAAGDTLFVDYTGVRSEDGFVFDTSYTRGTPFDFVLGRGGVIAGWDQGLLGARAGSLVKLDIPAALAYGDTPPGDVIQPGDALTFVLEVRAVVPPTTVDEAPLDLDLPTSVGALEVSTNDIRVGDGATVELGDTAIVRMLFVRGDNRVVLLNTWERDDPLRIPIEDGLELPGVISGLQGARVGGLREIIVPPDLAFGPDGEASLGLPAGIDLIVVAEILGVY